MQPHPLAGALLDPLAVTEVHRELWAQRSALVGRTAEVTACPYSAAELAALAAAGRRVGYLPPEMATRSTRHVLGEIFPAMGCYSLQPDNEVDNIVSPAGWFDYEGGGDAPYLGTDEAALLGAVAAEGRRLMSLNQYIVASQDTKMATGRYLDERRTWARVGIRVTGRIVSVRFDGDEVAEGMGDEPPLPGALLTGYDLHHEFSAPYVGGRTFGVAAAQRDEPLLHEPPAPARGVHPSQSDLQDLDAEWHRQAERLLSAGFHTALGMSADDYLASLPRFAPQPAPYRGRLDVPVIVENRLPWERQFELIGIAVSPFMAYLPPLQPVDAASGPRERPYAAWFNRWGERFTEPTAPADARASLLPDEVGANLHEGGAVLLAFPELVSTARFFDFVGYVCPPGPIDGDVPFAPIERTPGVCRWRGRPELACNLYPLAFSVFRPLIRGRAVTEYTP